jgi:L-lactate dehydrogenase (cytochrome)/(S)-mandelate dehydrogenase
MWPGKFVIKGILHPEDAIRAAEHGVDGLIVSNHGGRKIDRAMASVDAFPAIHAAVGDRMTLMLDSGIRRGSDIVTALCLGAKFCFVGRATLYGVAAGGIAGAKRAIAILRNEVDILLSQLGVPNARELGPDMLHREYGGAL